MPEENAVALKLPAFWTSQPAVWFIQAEAQFTLRNITADDTKYAYLVAALDQTTATRLLDILSNPPDNDKYKALKKRLTSTYGLSRRDRAAALLHVGDLGDRKPSELMDEMLSLLGDHTPCLLFEQLFLERMPTEIRLQLANDTSFNDLRAAAAKADELWQARKTGRTTAIQEIHHMERKKGSTSKLKNSQAPQVTNTSYCFYHSKFGDNAHKCHPPCTYPGNATADRV